MHIQSSFQDNDKGSLFIVPTPIGNLEDMTFRAVSTLKEVDLILAEDTRHTQKLLTHFSIQNTMLSFHEHNQKERMGKVLEYLIDGDDLALVSDAGMPAVSDPGYELVHEAIQEDIPVIVLPGANAALCSLVGSGLPTNEFLFYGFLPRKTQRKADELKRLAQHQATIIFYESPFRVKETLNAIKKYIGNRSVVISREITKVYEQYIRGSCSELLEWIAFNEIKGECCILIEGSQGQSPNEKNWWEELSIIEHVIHYEETQEKTNKEALKLVAKDRGIPKREVYYAVHVEE